MSNKLFEAALSAFQAGDLFEAEKSLRKARGALTDQPEDLAKVHFMLAMILEKDNRIEEALDSLKACYTLRAATLGESNAATALTLKIWASVAAQLPGIEAVELQRKCVSQAEALLGADNTETVSARMKLAAVLVQCGIFDEAFTTLLSCERAVEGDEKLDVIATLESLLPKVTIPDAHLLVSSLKSSS